MIDILQTAIISRIKSRLGLQYGALAPQLKLHESVQMVTDVDPLLSTPRIISYLNQDLTGAAGYQPLVAVPVGKLWTLKSYYHTATTGDCRIAVFDGTSQHFFSPADTAAVYETNMDIPLKTGWIIQVRWTANGADGAISFGFFVMEEDSY